MLLDRLFNLRGKVVFVSGASSGLDLRMAQVLAEAGAAVALAARRTDKLAEAVAELQGRGARACAVPLDVTRSDTIGPAFDAAESALGAGPDVLINNAGILYAERFVDQDEVEVAGVVSTNLLGAFRVAQECARRMVAAKGGAIVQIASTAGLRAAGFLSSYAASKAGLLHLSQVMALELASRGVRVNTICPGNFETDMHQIFIEGGHADTLRKRIPQHRFGVAEDLDGAVLLLASDASRYITGAVLTVDGGQALAWM